MTSLDRLVKNVGSIDFELDRIAALPIIGSASGLVKTVFGIIQIVAAIAIAIFSIFKCRSCSKDLLKNGIKDLSEGVFQVIPLTGTFKYSRIKQNLYKKAQVEDLHSYVSKEMDLLHQMPQDLSLAQAIKLEYRFGFLKNQISSLPIPLIPESFQTRLLNKAISSPGFSPSLLRTLLKQGADPIKAYIYSKENYCSYDIKTKLLFDEIVKRKVIKAKSFTGLPLEMKKIQIVKLNMYFSLIPGLNLIASVNFIALAILQTFQALVLFLGILIFCNDDYDIGNKISNILNNLITGIVNLIPFVGTLLMMRRFSDDIDKNYSNQKKIVRDEIAQYYQTIRDAIIIKEPVPFFSRNENLDNISKIIEYLPSGDKFSLSLTSKTHLAFFRSNGFFIFSDLTFYNRHPQNWRDPNSRELSLVPRCEGYGYGELNIKDLDQCLKRHLNALKSRFKHLTLSAFSQRVKTTAFSKRDEPAKELTLYHFILIASSQMDSEDHAHLMDHYDDSLDEAIKKDLRKRGRMDIDTSDPEYQSLLVKIKKLSDLIPTEILTDISRHVSRRLLA